MYITKRHANIVYVFLSGTFIVIHTHTHTHNTHTHTHTQNSRFSAFAASPFGKQRGTKFRHVFILQYVKYFGG